MEISPALGKFTNSPQKKLLTLTYCFCRIYCTEMINIVSQRIGNVNIYNIYEPCVSTLPPGVGKMRYALYCMLGIFQSLIFSLIQLQLISAAFEHCVYGKFML